MKQQLLAVWADMRATVNELWRGFKGESKYFQYKAYIGAAYIALVLITVIAVVPRSPSNKLKAYVLAATGDFVVGSYVMVRNDSSKDWERVRLTLNGTHMFNVARIPAGEKVTVQLPKFEGDGPLTPDLVHELRIDCSRGHEVYAVKFAGRR